MKRTEQRPPQPFRVPVEDSTGVSVDLQEAEVRRRAYQIYEERGMTPGSDLEDWFQAEAEIRQKQRPQKAA